MANSYPFSQADLDLLRKKGNEDTFSAQDPTFQNYTSGDPAKDELLKNVLQANKPGEYSLLDALSKYGSQSAQQPQAVGNSVATGAMAGVTSAGTPETPAPEKQMPASEEMPTYNPSMKKESGPALGAAVGSEASRGVAGAETPQENAAPSEEQQAKAPYATLDFGQDNLASQENLQKAQDAKNAANLTAILGKSGDIIGQGISGARYTNPVWDEISKHAGDAVQDYANKLALQKDDPNSAYSKGFKDYLSQMGLDIKGDITANQAEKLMPEVFKHYEAQLAQNLKRELAGKELEAKQSEKQTNREFLASQNQQNRDLKQMLGEGNLDVRRQLAGSKEEAAAKKGEENDKKYQDKIRQEAQQAIYGSRQRPDVRQAEIDMYNIGKAKKLFQGNLNNLSKGQISLLISEIGKIAKGGVPDAQEYKALTPSAFAQSFAGFFSKLTNDPTPQNAGRFLKQYKKYIEDLDANAKEVVARNVGAQLRPRRAGMGEKHFKALVKENQDILPEDFDKQSDNQENSNPGFDVDRDAIAAEMAKRGLK